MTTPREWPFWIAVIYPRRASTMPHAAEISRAAPSCFLFVVDQSGSMEDAFAGANAGRSKAQELADIINRLLQTLVTRCARGEDVHDYFDVGVLGYGDTVGP